MERALDFCRQYDMLPAGGLVLAAVSGGADSMCLVHWLASAAADGGFTVAAAHFNHRLRGAASDEDEAFVRDWCAGRGIPFFAGSGDVRAFAAANALGIEAAARALRYDFLERTADETGALRIATAHTADDDLETILLHLARGTGLRGLGGIPPVRGRVVRPLLQVTRDEVEAYLAAHGVPHREDATNASNDYARNRLRHRVVPVLKELNPAVREAAASAAELLRADEAYLAALAEDHIAAHVRGGRLDAAALAALPFPVASRVVRALCGGDLGAKHVKAALALAASPDPSAALSLPGMTLRREYGELVFAQEPESEAAFEPRTIAPGETVLLPACGLRATCEALTLAGKNGSIHKSFTTFLFKRETLCGKITLAPRRGADRIRLSEKGGTKAVRRLFIDKKIPVSRRGLIPVLSDEAGPIAVAFYGQDVRTFPAPGDAVIKVTIEEIDDDAR